MRRAAASLLLRGVPELLRSSLAAPGVVPAAMAAAQAPRQAATSLLRGWSALARSPAAAAAAAGGSLAARQQLGGALQRAAWAGGQAAAGAAAHRAWGLQARRWVGQLHFPRRGGGWGGGGGWGLDGEKVLWGLIAVNAGVFLLWRTNPALCWKNFVVSIESLQSGRLHTAATAAFSHRDFAHLFANMFTLYFFGRDIARLFGGSRLLALYLAGGVVGSLAHCGWYYYQACKRNQGRFGRHNFFAYAPPALGASASVNAIVCFDILLFPKRTVLLYGLLPMPAALLGLGWLLYDIAGTMEGKGHIAHAGHLGGAATGLAFFLLRGRFRPRGWGY